MPNETPVERVIVVYLPDIYQDNYIRIGNQIYQWCKTRHPDWSLRYPADIRQVGVDAYHVGCFDIVSAANDSIIFDKGKWRRNEPITVRS